MVEAGPIRRPATRADGAWFWAAVAVSLAVSLTPWGGILLYPFRLFTTWAHECGHALAAVLAAGEVRSITIAADGSGLARSTIPDGRLTQAFVASAGYLGAASVGCLLMAATRAERWARVIVWAITGCLVASAVFWVRNLFGLTMVIAWAAALVVLANRRTATAARFVLGLLAVQVALNAVFDIRVLFLGGIGPTDADAMAAVLLLPAWFWASAWMATSLAMLGGTLWLTRGAR